MKVIMVVAHDLAHDRHNRICIGPGTKQTCLHALKLVEESRGSTLVITVGQSTSEWERVSMGSLMAGYINSRNKFEVSMFQFPAPKFNTSSEMESLARFALSMGVRSITIAVKWWHAPRAWWLCRYWLLRYGVSGVSVKTSPHASDSSMFDILREWFVAIPLNCLRGTLLTTFAVLRWLFPPLYESWRQQF